MKMINAGIGTQAIEDSFEALGLALEDCCHGQSYGSFSKNLGKLHLQVRHEKAIAIFQGTYIDCDDVP